jgi:hypothetical protein
MEERHERTHVVRNTRLVDLGALNGDRRKEDHPYRGHGAGVVGEVMRPRKRRALLLVVVLILTLAFAGTAWAAYVRCDHIGQCRGRSCPDTIIGRGAGDDLSTAVAGKTR